MYTTSTNNVVNNYLSIQYKSTIKLVYFCQYLARSRHLVSKTKRDYGKQRDRSGEVKKREVWVGSMYSIAREHVSVAKIKSNLYLDLTQLVHEFSVFFSQ